MTLVLFLTANVLFATGLIFHAFLYNFYLGALDLSPAVMGRAAAALTAGGLATLLPAGWLVDRLGPRLALVIGGAITAAGLAAGAVTTQPLAVYAAAAVAGAGGAVWRVTQAPTLVRLTHAGQRSRLFSWNVGLIIGVGALGVAVAGAVPEWLGRLLQVTPLVALRLGLLLGAVGTASSLVLFAFIALPREAPRGTAEGETARAAVAAAHPLAPGATATLRRTLGFVALVGVWMLGPALVAPFFNIYFARQFSIGVARIGLIFGLVHGLWALMVLASGELATRVGPPRVLAAWLLLLGPALLFLPAAGLQVAVGLYFLQGVTQPAANPLVDQLLMERSAPRVRGIVSGWRNAAADGSAIAGASIGGWVLDAGSFTALFVAAGAWAVVAAIGLVAGLRKFVST